jgi:nucleoid-associated protein YgaU
MPTTKKLEKAYLAIVAPPKPATKPPRLSEVLSKARSGAEGEVVFTFNPNEFSISKSASWSRTPQRGAAGAAMPQFTGSEPASLSLEVFFDASEASSPKVAKDVQRLLDTVTPLQKTISADRPSPPWVVFGWGKFMSFVAIVKSVNAKYTMFLPDGTPIRATATLTLEEIPTDPPPRQNPTSGALTSHRTHQMIAGDSLPSVAQAEYGDPGLWRVLAEANDIDDPMRVAPGTTLLVPHPSEVAEQTEEARA